MKPRPSSAICTWSCWSLQVSVINLICAALVLGLTLTHDLEIPGKHMLSGAEWLNMQHTFYGGFAGTIAVFAFGNNPLNQQIATWTPATLPASWRAVRDAWDSFHAASSGLSALSLVCLLIAMLRDTPGVERRIQSPELA